MQRRESERGTGASARLGGSAACTPAPDAHRSSAALHSAHCFALRCVLLLLQAKDRILLDHELKHQLDELCACQAKLLELYEDADGSERNNNTRSSRRSTGVRFRNTLVLTLSALRCSLCVVPEPLSCAR